MSLLTQDSLRREDLAWVLSAQPAVERGRGRQIGQKHGDTSSRESSQCDKEDLELDLWILRLLPQKKREGVKRGGEREGGFLTIRRLQHGKFESTSETWRANMRLLFF